MQPYFGKKIRLRIYKTNISAQKIDDNRLQIYGMIIILFQIDDKNGKSHFFKKILALTDIIMDVTSKILFLIFSNVEVNFNN